MSATGKDIQRILTIRGDQAPSASAASSRPASPIAHPARSKLSAIQNLMTKQRESYLFSRASTRPTYVTTFPAQLPGTFPRTSGIPRKPSIPYQKDKQSNRSTPNSRAATPVDKPLPIIVDEKPKSRSFFSTHKRTKSAVTTSGGATPLTPKAAAPAPPPRVPPPTPCTPGTKHHDAEIPAVPIAAAAVLQRQALEKRGVVIIESQPDPRLPLSPNTRKARVPSPTAPTPITRTPPLTAAAKLRAPTPPQFAINSPKVLTPIRSALRPVPGKENVSNVKVKVRAFESRTVTSASSIPVGVGVKPRVGERTPTKGVLRLKDRNRMQENVDEKPGGPPKDKQLDAVVGSGSGGDKGLAPKRSLLRKSKLTLHFGVHGSKGLRIAQSRAPQSRKRTGKFNSLLPKTNKRVVGGGLCMLSRDQSTVRTSFLGPLNISNPITPVTRPGVESPINHIRHSVRKSIGKRQFAQNSWFLCTEAVTRPHTDKTADFFGHKASGSGTNSISRRVSRSHKMAAELKELQDSWDDLAKDRVFQSVGSYSPLTL